MVENIINEYKKGLSVIEISNKLKIDWNKVKRTLIKNNIKIRTRGETQALNRNYRCFEKIDSEEKAYWLGFIMADGCCFKNKLSIGLKGEDKPHLEKFKLFINSPNKISAYNVLLNSKTFSVCSFTVTSKELVEDLLLYGVTEKKSNTLNPALENIPEIFLKDFWRGVIDGDGSIFLCPKNNSLTVSLVGTKEVCVKFLTYFKRKNINYYEKIDNKTKMVSISGKQGLEALSKLYNNSVIHLERKYNKYLKGVDTINNYKENILPVLRKANGLNKAKKVKAINTISNEVLEFESLALLRSYFNLTGGGFNTTFKQKSKNGKLYKNIYKFSYC